MNRRTFLKATGAAALAAAAPGGCLPPDADRPNLLFVMADQWRFCALGDGTGSPVATPNIDRLAREGLRCTRAYVANPLCAPSRASIMTGRLPHEHGVIANQLTLPPGERGIAESFARAGYRTHYIGKWHLNGVPRPGFVPAGWRRRGFETFEGFNRGHWYERTRTFTNEGELIHPDAFESTYQTDRAIAFVRESRGEPFFCFLSWGPPHPSSAGVKGSSRFDGGSPPWRENVPDRFRRRPALVRQIGEYYDLCEQLDAELGRLLAALEEEGIAERTLVVFTSDHGDMLGSHGLMYKEHPFEESIRVPLIVRQPGRIAAGRETGLLVSNIDLMPSLTALCGLDAPVASTGRDVSGALLGGKDVAASSVYCQGRMGPQSPARGRTIKGSWRAVVTPRHKLVVDSTDSVVRLTDLEEDPLERENLAGSAAHADLARQLRGELDDWRSRTVDPFPKPPTAASAAYSDTREPIG